MSPSVSADNNYYCLCPILTPTHTAPCPTLSPLSNGMISYNATTNMATYTCDTAGYAPTITMASGSVLQITCTSAGTWSPTPPTACAREYCTYRLLNVSPCMHHNRSANYTMFYSNRVLSSGITFCWRLGNYASVRMRKRDIR